MHMLRFPVFIIAAFAATFGAVFWGRHALDAYRASPAANRPSPLIHELPATVTTTFGDHSSEQKKQALVQEIMNDPANARRDPMRLETLQAAVSYSLSPCDETTRIRFIAAARTYATGFAEMRKCNPMFTNCDPIMDKAAAAYATPLDLRVRDALHEAFERGGVSKDDFPPKIRMDVMSLANSMGNPDPVCAKPTELRQ